MVRLFLVLLTVGGLSAAEHALLHTGSVLLVERHELEGDTMRLHTATGVIELPASSVTGFEPVIATEAASESAAISVSPPQAAPPRTPVEMVESAASRFGLPPALLHSVARVESAYRPDAISPKGAIGIMQLMPATAVQLNANPHDPEQNVEAGARHLRELLIQYNGETAKALAAYNAGAGAVARYNGVPPYAETQNYVEKVLRNYWKLASKSQTNRSELEQ